MNKIYFDYDFPFGLYIHIPFCTHRCSYCDFYSQIYSPQMVQQFIVNLKKEISIYAELLDNREIKSIYFGGGTPSLLSVREVADILEYVQKYFSLENNIEITLEANPHSLTEDKIEGYYQKGINRLSLGIQSFNKKELLLLDRLHSGEKAVEVIEKTKKIYGNFNIDLIFAIPGQDYTDWEENLHRAVELFPTHISTYNLEIHENTSLSNQFGEGKLAEISEENDAAMYKLAVNYLQENGYRHYEISSFALPGYESVHNKLYWQFAPYLGLGPAAHSFNGQQRFYNYADLKKYIRILANNNLPLGNIIPLSTEDLRAEMMIMGLRLRKGIPKKMFYNRFGVNIEDVYSEELKGLIEQGLLLDSDRNYRLTEKGLLLGNQVFAEFLPA